MDKIQNFFFIERKLVLTVFNDVSNRLFGLPFVWLQCLLCLSLAKKCIYATISVIATFRANFKIGWEVNQGRSLANFNRV